MSNINKKVKTPRLKKAIKITPEDIKISLENLIDDVNKKTSSIQKEIDRIFEKLNKLPGKKYQYKEKFVIDEDHPIFTNEIDNLDYIHESLIFKYAQLEIKLNTLKDIEKKKQVEIIKVEIQNYKKHINDLLNNIKKIKTTAVVKNINIEDDDNIKNCKILIKKLHNVNREYLQNNVILDYNIYNEISKNLQIIKLNYESIESFYVYKIEKNREYCSSCNYLKECCICDKCNRCENRNFDRCRCTISTKLRIDVWDKYIGLDKNSHKCLCCLKNIIQFKPSTFHCGHIKSRYNGGSISIHNLRPICRKCNKEMGILNMNKYIQTCHPRLI